jgi:small subunit ribosomal protein S34
MPDYGVGKKFNRKTWPEDSYWTMTKIDFKDPGHGKAWGVLTWKGESKSGKEERILGPLKRGIWQYKLD